MLSSIVWARRGVPAAVPRTQDPIDSEDEAEAGTASDSLEVLADLTSVLRKRCRNPRVNGELSDIAAMTKACRQAVCARLRICRREGCIGIMLPTIAPQARTVMNNCLPQCF